MTDQPKLIVFRASDAEAAIVDAAAARMGVSKSQFLRIAIAKRIDEVMALAYDGEEMSERSDVATELDTKAGTVGEVQQT